MFKCQRRSRQKRQGSNPQGRKKAQPGQAEERIQPQAAAEEISQAP